MCMICFCFFFSSRRRHTRCALVTGVQTCALPILALARSRAAQVRQQLATTKAERQSALMRVFQFVGDTSFDPGTVPIYDAAVSHPDPAGAFDRSEEHTSELQSLMRISYDVFCLQKKKVHSKQSETFTKARD